MKKLCFLFLLFLGMLSTQTLMAQDTATNNSDEAWYVNYYGATYTINPTASPVSISPGTECEDGITVRNSDACFTFTFTVSPTTQQVSCSSDTDEVHFTGDIDPSPTFCTLSATSNIFENIAIVFD